MADSLRRHYTRSVPRELSYFFQGIIGLNFRGRQDFPGKNARRPGEGEGGAASVCGGHDKGAEALDGATEPRGGMTPAGHAHGGVAGEDKRRLVLGALDALFVRVHAFIRLVDQKVEADGVRLPDEAQRNAARIGGLAILLHLFQLVEEDIFMDLVADENKFIAADAEDIAAAKMACKDPAYVDDEFVALFMAIGIIEIFEIVEIDEKDAHIVHVACR